MQRKFGIWSNSSCSDNRKSAIQNRKWLGLLIVALALVATGAAAQAQQPKKVPRIGCLYATSLSSTRIKAFRQGLRELGYVDGENITIEWRSAEGEYDRLPRFAAELVRLKVDIIITGGAPAVRAVKEATVTIPIVMTQVGNPVGSGFVA